MILRINFIINDLNLFVKPFATHLVESPGLWPEMKAGIFPCDFLSPNFFRMKNHKKHLTLYLGTGIILYQVVLYLGGSEMESFDHRPAVKNGPEEYQQTLLRMNKALMKLTMQCRGSGPAGECPISDEPDTCV